MLGIWHFARGAAASAPSVGHSELELLRRKRAEVATRMREPTGEAWRNFNGTKAARRSLDLAVLHGFLIIFGPPRSQKR